jgi:hypothetical protein
MALEDKPKLTEAEQKFLDMFTIPTDPQSREEAIKLLKGLTDLFGLTVGAVVGGETKSEDS